MGSENTNDNSNSFNKEKETYKSNINLEQKKSEDDKEQRLKTEKMNKISKLYEKEKVQIKHNDSTISTKRKHRNKYKKNQTKVVEKKIDITKDTSSKSLKEEVVVFFESKFSLNQDISNKFINEYITGDILPNLSFNDFKFLGLNLETIINWNKYYDENEDNFDIDEIKEEISYKATSEEVKHFFESYLDFKENINNLNGQMLLDLNEESMKQLGMKLGQRKRLTKYINYLNKMKNIITINSSKEEVANFLLKNSNLSKQTIEKLQFDGKLIFNLDLNSFNGNYSYYNDYDYYNYSYPSVNKYQNNRPISNSERHNYYRNYSYVNYNNRY